jgi:predicted DNA-binding transcriptional regulator AlpA
MGIAEIAARLGVGKNWAREITGQKGFPDGTKLTMGWVWATEDVEAYIARRWPDKARPRPD